MASPRQRPSPRHRLSDHSDYPSDDSVGIGYPLTRQPGRTFPRHQATLPLLPTESRQSRNTTGPTTEGPIGPETHTANIETMTMNISLQKAELVQLFLRGDGSVKGLSFNYEDTDLADLGCCVAEPDRWYAFVRPQWLLFTPSPGRPLYRGFFRVDSISFAEILDGTETETRAIRMQGSLMFRHSANGLEIDIGNRGRREVIQLVEEEPEIEQRGGIVGETKERGRKRIFEKARQALKACFGGGFVLSRWSTRVREIGKKTSSLARRIGREL